MTNVMGWAEVATIRFNTSVLRRVMIVERDAKRGQTDEGKADHAGECEVDIAALLPLEARFRSRDRWLEDVGPAASLGSLQGWILSRSSPRKMPLAICDPTGFAG